MEGDEPLEVAGMNAPRPEQDKEGSAGGAARWVATAVAVAIALYVSLGVAGYLLWVAHSALLGIRDDPDYFLGTLCVLVALAPFGAAVTAYRSSIRGRSMRRGIVRGAIAGATVGAVGLAFAVMLMGPF